MRLHSRSLYYILVLRPTDEKVTMNVITKTFDMVILLQLSRIVFDERDVRKIYKISLEYPLCRNSAILIIKIGTYNLFFYLRFLDQLFFLNIRKIELL